MTRRLNPRHRRTHLGLDVGRAVGFYEQCDHRNPGAGDLSRANRSDRLPALPALPGSLVARGLVGLPGILAHPSLRSIAGSDRVSDFDARAVSVVDLLGRVRLDATAELVMWHEPDGGQTATPIARLLDDPGSHLVLGGDENARPQWSTPVVLRAAGLPKGDEIEVIAFTAMTFAEFVGAGPSSGPR